LLYDLYNSEERAFGQKMKRKSLKPGGQGEKFDGKAKKGSIN
jgi:hypothetical protein